MGASIRDIGNIMLQTPTNEQRGAGGFKDFVDTLNNVINSEAEKKMAIAKAEEDKRLKELDRRIKTMDMMSKYGAAEKSLQEGSPVNFEQSIQSSMGGGNLNEGDVIPPKSFTFDNNSQPNGTPLAQTDNEKQVLSEAVQPNAVTIPKIEAKESGKQLYERNVFQPVMGEDGKIKYEFLKTEMSTTPGDKYLQNPPQSNELPIGMEIGKAVGGLEMLSKNLDEAKKMIVENKLSPGWLRAQLANPTAVGKSKEQNMVLNRVRPVVNRLINLLSGAATSVQEQKRIESELFPQIDEDIDTYFDRLMLAERGATSIVNAASMSKKELVASGKANKKSAETEKNNSTHQRKVVKTQLNKVTGEERIVYDDGSTEIIKSK